jgi:DNA-binding response OmpR family regulator
VNRAGYTETAPKIATILIIEDDERLGILMRDIFTIEGHRVDTARTGERAWEQLSRHDYDLILCDMAVAGLDSPAFYRRLATTRPKLTERVTFLSRRPLQDVEALLDVRGLSVLQLPFQVNEVLRLTEGFSR